MWFVSSLIIAVQGHGRLMDPPGRSSMWRFAETNDLLRPFKDMIAIHYTDNGLNCGGRDFQASQNGACGVCGDAVNLARPRPHEDGGKYGKGIISGQFEPGQVMTTQTQITAHHKGWVEFKLCSRETTSANDLKSCLDDNILQVTSGGSKFMLEDTHDSHYARGGYWYEIDVVLPASVTCTRCVLQWRYRAGNSWGCDKLGDCGLGKGAQEEFVNCADIQISGDVTVTTPPPLTASSRTTTTLPDGKTCGEWESQHPFVELVDNTSQDTKDSCSSTADDGKLATFVT